MTQTQMKKVRIHVKGKLRNSVHKYFSHKKAKKYGVHMHQISYKANDHAELLLEGDRADLWELVNWHKRGPILCSVSEVDIEFID